MRTPGGAVDKLDSDILADAGDVVITPRFREGLIVSPPGLPAFGSVLPSVGVPAVGGRGHRCGRGRKPQSRRSRILIGKGDARELPELVVRRRGSRRCWNSSINPLSGCNFSKTGAPLRDQVADFALEPVVSFLLWDFAAEATSRRSVCR
jgi:hypothetical protein